MSRCRLADLGKIVTGSTPSSKEPHLFGSDVPFLTPSDMAFDRRNVPTARGISAAGTARFKTRLLPSRAVSVVCIGATIGKTCMTERPVLTNQQINSIVVDESRHSPDYVYYLMLTMRDRLRAVASGAATPIINKSVFGSLEVNIPDRKVQTHIGDYLKAFDDLIENNRRRIETLEEMARLLYREWFVHLRYPGHEDVELVDSDLGPIPEGWGQARLSEVCLLVMGQSPKSEYYNDIGEGLPFHQGVSDFGNRYPTHTKWTTVDNRVAESGDILFSVRAPVGRINVAPDRLVLGRGLSAIRALDGNQNFLLAQLKEEFAVEDSIGGGTIFNAVTKKDMESIMLLRPTNSVVEEFEAVVAPMADLVANLSQQNIALREVRDLLLPRLVSGELDVSELDLDLVAV